MVGGAARRPSRARARAWRLPLQGSWPEEGGADQRTMTVRAAVTAWLGQRRAELVPGVDKEEQRFLDHVFT